MNLDVGKFQNRKERKFRNFEITRNAHLHKSNFWVKISIYAISQKLTCSGFDVRQKNKMRTAFSHATFYKLPQCAFSNSYVWKTSYFRHWSMTKISFVSFSKNEMCKWALANFWNCGTQFLFLLKSKPTHKSKSTDKT